MSLFAAVVAVWVISRVNSQPWLTILWIILLMAGLGVVWGLWMAFHSWRIRRYVKFIHEERVLTISALAEKTGLDESRVRRDVGRLIRSGRLSGYELNPADDVILRDARLEAISRAEITNGRLRPYLISACLILYLLVDSPQDLASIARGNWLDLFESRGGSSWGSVGHDNSDVLEEKEEEQRRKTEDWGYRQLEEEQRQQRLEAERDR